MQILRDENRFTIKNKEPVIMISTQITGSLLNYNQLIPVGQIHM